MNPSKIKVSRAKGLAYTRFNEWLDYFEIQNVAFTNLSGDSEWDFKFKSFDHEFLLGSISPHDKIIAWGSLVSAYLKRLGVKNHFVLPHPSPRNRKLNDHKYVHHMLKKCKEYLDE